MSNEIEIFEIIEKAKNNIKYINLCDDVTFEILLNDINIYNYLFENHNHFLKNYETLTIDKQILTFQHENLIMNGDILLNICKKYPYLVSYIMKLCDEDIINYVDSRGNNCLMIACKYQPVAVYYIMESKLFNSILTQQINIQGNNFFMIAYCFQSEAVYYIKNSRWYDKNLVKIVNKKGFDCLKIAYLFNQDIIKI